MSATTNRINPRLQVLIVSAMGWKYSQHLQLCYKSGETATLLMKIGNHHNLPETGVYPKNNGRVTLSVADAYWQGNKFQIKEVRNANPNGGTPWDATLDVGWNNVHGYKFENIPAGAYRDFLLRINGTSLTFADVRELITFVFPSPA